MLHAAAMCCPIYNGS